MLVTRLRRALELKARIRRRYKHTTVSDHDQPISPNLLDQKFEATAPNCRWVGDTSKLLVGEHGGKRYLAVILELYSRFVVGWALSARNDRHLVMKAMEMSLLRRRPKPGLIFHSDQGSPYASADHQKLLRAHGLVGSMSRRGNCYDNSAMESWFSTYKAELGERFSSRAEVKDKTFDYIEAFYNRRRRHSSLGYRSPLDFENDLNSTQREGCSGGGSQGGETCPQKQVGSSRLGCEQLRGRRRGVVQVAGNNPVESPKNFHPDQQTNTFN